MVFSSISFIFLFLPVVLLLVFITRGFLRNYILIVSSIIFYAIGEKEYTLIMIVSILINYFFAKLIETNRGSISKMKQVLTTAIFINIGILAYFKYFKFLTLNLFHLLDITSFNSFNFDVHLPIGVSFITFQSMSYVIDVYRGTVSAQKKISNVALLNTMFPHLIAGPIVRFADIQHQFEKRIVSIDQIEKGIIRFIYGLGKKVLIANNLALVADGVFNSEIRMLTTEYAWIGIIAYSLQIYFDFSGYSDMAIGLARIMGFTFLENFNYPYISGSIKEFWRRWHISLSTWFRDYLYIPLGGNRRGLFRTYINMIIVFFLTGLWHGAEWTFVIWGLYHGFFLILERMGLNKLISKLKIGNLYTILVVMIGWVFFRASDFHYALKFIKLLFSFNNSNTLTYDAFRFVNSDFVIALTAGIIFSLPVMPFLNKKINSFFPESYFYKMVIHVNTFIIFSFCIVYLARGSYNPFIYFRF